MRLKIKLVIMVVITISALLVFGLATYQMTKNLRTTLVDLYDTNEIVMDIFNLNMLTHDYLGRQTKRSYSQWLSTYQEIGSHLDFLKAKYPLRRGTYQDVLRKYEQIGETFSRLLVVLEKEGVEENHLDKKLKDQLVRQLMLRAHVIVSSAVEMNKTLIQRVQEDIRTANIINSIIISVLFVLVGFLTFLIVNGIIRPIVYLQTGMERIASGNLNSRVDIISDDEVGQLAVSFNKMTQELKIAKEEIETYCQQLKKGKNNLEQCVIERTEELNAHIEELERFRRATIDREYRMDEMQKEIDRLKKQINESQQ